MNLKPRSGYYVFKDRSCANCKKSGTCPAIVGKDFRQQWLDLARTGCKLYVGPYQKERRMMKHLEKIGKNCREILKPFQLEREQETFLILYVVGGYSQSDAYRAAWPDTKAVKGLAALACTVLNALDKPARKLASYAQIRTFSTPARFRADISTLPEF